MKKTLALILILLLSLTMLTACGNQETDNKSSDNNNKTSKLIKASSLITSEDVGRILNVDMLNNEDDVIDLEDELGGYSQCVYNSEPYMYQIFLYQDALLNEKALKNGGTVWGFRNLVDGYKNKEEWRDYIIKVDGIGEEAYLTDMTGLERWTLNILQSGYRIDMIITYNPLKHKAFEGENEWKVEKLKEIGKLAVERLEAIIK